MGAVGEDRVQMILIAHRKGRRGADIFKPVKQSGGRADAVTVQKQDARVEVAGGVGIGGDALHPLDRRGAQPSPPSALDHLLCGRIIAHRPNQRTAQI